MKLFLAYLHILLFLSLATTPIATPKYAKTGCKDTCGNVRIPYPFGIGVDCSVNKWYTVDCNNSTPYLSTLKNLELLGVNLKNLTVTVSTPRPTDCQNPVWNRSGVIDLGGSPFLFSKRHNKFVFEGCGIAVMLDNGSAFTGCSTACSGVTVSDINNCFGIGCCHAEIPHYLKSYNVNITRLEVEYGSCESAFLVDEEAWFSVGNNSFIPVSLRWTLAQSDQVTCCDNEAPKRCKVDMFNGSFVDSMECNDVMGYLGNPYLVDGCKQDNNVKRESFTEECKRCKDNGGSCATQWMYNGAVFFTCREHTAIPAGILAGRVGMILIFLFPISFLSYQVIKITKSWIRRKRFFKRNGGLILKQQEEADSSLVGKTIHFTARELKMATNNFNENRILGQGGQGTVYKGMLADGRIVAIKKSKVVDESQLEQFINEVVVLSQINHRNVVKLLGCCLETYVPLLVSEFIPNGTLYDRLHNETDEFLISLDMRLRIATEVAGALAYLHSATSIPVYHRDIKTTNILLDDKYRAKVSDFGTSRFVSMDQTHLTTLVKVSKYAKTGCNDTCGSVTIPYPFGIGPDCSVNSWYTVDCNSSKPYLSALNHLEVLRVDLDNQTVIVGTPTISNCQNPVQNGTQITSINLHNTPFLFCSYHNRFVFNGCGNAIMTNNGSVLTGCSTSCVNETVRERNNECFGISCCQTTIPYYIKSYNITIIGFGGDGGCGHAFLVDDDSYLKGSFSIQSLVAYNVSVPMSLMWTLPHSIALNCCHGAADHMNMELDMGNGTFVESQKCFRHIGYKGNPFLSDGCEVIEDCASCPDSSCNYDIIYGGDGSSTKVINFSCGPIVSPTSFGSKSSTGVILGVSISLGVLFLVATIYALYKWIKKTKERRQRKRFFKRNGGLLLKQQEEADPSLVGKTILFTSHELEKATDNFNENRILGKGGQGTVYKGMLVDGRIVAIKKSKVVDESQLQHFINEVVILSQVNHRNVVKLLGCCLETDVPLLVSEFVPNGTLYNHLHNENGELPISLNMRLQIATEVAGALAYLHSATSIPIYHRDIKTTNILLDDKYRAKVSDFGTSRFVSTEKTHLTTLVKGTFGYLDPEYFQSSQFTEKSDVYSFGVVLVELLTRERPISQTRFGEHRSLATHFMLAMEEDRVMSIFDTMVIKEGTRDELLILANLAMRCLNLNGRYRPTMKEVAIELETIRASHIPSKVETNIMPMVYGEELSFITYSETSSTFLSGNDSIGQ